MKLKTTKINEKINMMTGINESRTLKKHLSCKCECEFDGRNCNSNQKWNKHKCLCECNM